MWPEITYPFPNFDTYTLKTVYWACDYLSMLGFKLNPVNKRDSGEFFKTKTIACFGPIQTIFWPIMACLHESIAISKIYMLPYTCVTDWPPYRKCHVK